jgi:hypothetical protein
MKSSANEQYNNARSSLHSKKIKLFDSRNIEKWGTKSSEFKEPIDEVFKNFNIAEKYILPKEEEKLSKVRELSNFMTNSAYYEYVLFNKRDQRRIVKNFHKYAKKVSKATKNGEAIWNIFEKMKVDENNPAEVGGTGQQRNGNNQNDQFLNGLEDDLDRALQAQARGHGDEGHQGKGFLD